MGEICKHTIAALLYVSDYFDFKNYKAFLQKKLEKTNDEPVIIENFEKFEEAELLKFDINPKSKFGYPNQYIVKDFKLEENKLVFNIEYRFFYSSEHLQVFCRYESENLFIWSTQNVRRGKGIKPVDFFVLKFLTHHKKQLLEFLDTAKRQDIQKRITTNYGLKPEDFDKYFQLVLDDETGIKVIKKSEEAGLISIVEQQNELEGFIKELEELSKTVPSIADYRNKIDRILGFSIDKNDEDNYLVYTPIAAKPNKEQTKLISRFSTYINYEMEGEVKIFPGQKELLDKILELGMSYLQTPVEKKTVFSVCQKVFLKI